MEQQTAVEWLEEMLIDNKYLLKDAGHLFEKAKQIEKEQHSDTWDKALDTLEERGVYIRAWEDFDEYWKGKFKNK